MPATTEQESSTTGKFLTFDLGQEQYGLEILRVQEIVGLIPVTRVPRLPSFVRGVVNLRGRVIPVVDLRLAFGFPNAEDTERTCIIIVQVQRTEGAFTTMGVIVDEVSDVVDLPEGAAETAPDFGVEVDTSFIRGVGHIEDRVVLLLDIDSVLASDQLDSVTRAVTEAALDGS